MLIHTSYFKRWKSVPSPVSISLSVPNKFDGVRFMQLAPTWEIINNHRKRKGPFSSIQWDMQYVKEYYDLMSKRKIQSRWVVEQLRLVSNEVTLLCYETPDKFCHRHIVAYWIEKQMGIKIKEWEGE